MLSYDWPGNVRELENCVQHMVAINSGPLLHVADLPSNLQNHLHQKKSQYLSAAATAWPAGNESNAAVFPSEAPPVGAPPPVASIIPLMELERRAIMNALDYTK